MWLDDYLWIILVVFSVFRHIAEMLYQINGTWLNRGATIKKIFAKKWQEKKIVVIYISLEKSQINGLRDWCITVVLPTHYIQMKDI